VPRYKQRTGPFVARRLAANCSPRTSALVSRSLALLNLFTFFEVGNLRLSVQALYAMTFVFLVVNPSVPLCVPWFFPPAYPTPFTCYHTSIFETPHTGSPAPRAICFTAPDVRSLLLSIPSPNLLFGLHGHFSFPIRMAAAAFHQDSDPGRNLGKLHYSGHSCTLAGSGSWRPCCLDYSNILPNRLFGMIHGTERFPFTVRGAIRGDRPNPPPSQPPPSVPAFRTLPSMARR